MFPDELWLYVLNISDNSQILLIFKQVSKHFKKLIEKNKYKYKIYEIKNVESKRDLIAIKEIDNEIYYYYLHYSNLGKRYIEKRGGKSEYSDVINYYYILKAPIIEIKAEDYLVCSHGITNYLDWKTLEIVDRTAKPKIKNVDYENKYIVNNNDIFIFKIDENKLNIYKNDEKIIEIDAPVNNYFPYITNRNIMKIYFNGYKEISIYL